MREKPRDPARLHHILMSIDNIRRFLSDKKLDDFSENSMLYFAVVKNLEIIGEAAYMLTTNFKEKHSETPWHNIVGMRHYLVHGYYQASLDEIWQAATVDIIPLREQVEKYLAEFCDM